MVLHAVWAAAASAASWRAPAQAVEQSALARARLLAQTLPDRRNASTSGGEVEDHEFWIANADLLDAARREWGALHPALYDIERHEHEFLQPELVAAINACETERFCELLLEELAHFEKSGIPLRRPNGMNRYGAILDELGLKSSLDYLCRRYLRPLGQMLYPWLIAKGDADEHYGFIVRYKRGEDLALAEHADASVLTMNANLGVRGFSGGSLAFRGTRGVDDDPRAVDASLVDFSTFAPGDAILHLGGQYHEALPIEGGERVNMVVWLHAKYEVVRFAPHPLCDRLDATRRWRAFAWDASTGAAELRALAAGTTCGASDTDSVAQASLAEEPEEAHDAAAFDEL